MQIHLGGKTREIKYKYRTIKRIEREAGGKSLFFLLRREHLGFDSTCLLLWGGLLHEDEKITPEQVDEWLDEYLQAGGTFEALQILIGEALWNSKVLGKPDESPNPQAEATKNPTSA